MDEKTAIQQLKQGNLKSLDFLVRQHQLKAIRTANFITRDLPLAEDTVQDCFLQLPRSIGSFDATRPFEPWFLRIVVRAAVKAALKAARKVPVESETDEAWFERQFGSVNSAESEVERLDFERAVQGALLRLSPRQRAVIIQRYYLGWSEREMVAELKLAPGTVKWLLNAARVRLRALLGERSAE